MDLISVHSNLRELVSNAGALTDAIFTVWQGDSAKLCHQLEEAKKDVGRITALAEILLAEIVSLAPIPVQIAFMLRHTHDAYDIDGNRMEYSGVAEDGTLLFLDGSALKPKRFCRPGGFVVTHDKKHVEIYLRPKRV